MSAIELFTYADQDDEIRIVMIDSEPWFVLVDLCRVLGLTTPAKVVERLDDGVSRTHPIADSMGRTQQATIVSEAGMYEVVIRSDKPEAVKFRRWITSEVLPQIRKTGAYASPRALPTKKELALWVVEAEERAERAEAQVRELAVPASAWNELAEAAGDYGVADAAKVLSRDPQITIGRDRLFEFMRAERWVYRDGGRWRAYQSQVEIGRLTEKVGRPYLRDGAMHTGDPTVRVTPKGLAELHKRLGGSGQLALIAEVSA